MAGRVEGRVAQAATLLGVTEPVRAAGGIVVRDEGDTRRVVLVHRPRYDDWSFPKGKLLNGESEQDAALREVEEETGLRCRIERAVGTVSYEDRHGREKTVTYFRMEPVDGAFEPNDEVDEIRWTTAEEAERLLTHPHDRGILGSTLTDTAVYVVRHAKAGLRSRWTGPDEERPLTRRGRRQAERLVERFRDLEVGRIVSSPFVRCVQTVELLARDRGLEVETHPALAEGADGHEVLALVATVQPEPVVLCGHGREIGWLIDAIASRGASVLDPKGIAKGSVWELGRRDERIVSARYLPPSPA